MRIVPQLFVAMHTQAMKDGHALLAEELALEEKATDGSKEELDEARLRAAVKYCCRLRDVLGRTALHYAARAGQLGFVQWAIKILCTRPKAASEELLGYVEEKSNASNEIRRGVMSVKLPNAPPGPRKKMVVSLSTDAIRFFPEVRADDSTPELEVACEAFLFRKGTGAKGALIEIVMLKGGGGGPPPPPPPGHTGGYLHAPSGEGNEVIELYADNGTEARYWMAGLGVAVQSNGEAAAATLTHLVANGKASTRKPTQVELWARYALLNDTDWRGEGMLHALVRGLEPGDEAKRGQFLSWLIESGVSLIDGGDAMAPQMKGLVGKAAAEVKPGNGSSSSSSSALMLLVARAAAATKKENLDSACASMISLMIRQASRLLPTSELRV